MTKVTIYTDGAARGNPDGPGGYGAVIEFIDSRGNLHTKELSQGYVKTTNNRMELTAAIVALRALKEPCEVELYSDSKYVIEGITKWVFSWIRRNWRNVQNVDLWKQLLEETQRHTIKWNWVKGHDDNIYNNECDQVARKAAQGSELLQDDGYTDN